MTDYTEYGYPGTAKGLTAEALSLRTCDWVELEVLNKSQKGDQGIVEFNAWFHNDQGDRQVLHEKSVFQRINGRWLYVGGEVDSSPGYRLPFSTRLSNISAREF